ncbi:MAG: sulfide/dihydroorotate dehydrogenase-like FAD/NAD-binding protein [Dissulfurispiraceae bacterium]|jgi:ferredoxin--NADP+ reductase|nr:sulfide/dihydroorotate dehydrogenase-like FAD/NAD-binding protein [Dissulfurispiraceae bacterium]
MAKIIEKRLIRTPDVYYFKIAAPLISKKAQPGQFVMIRLHDQGERIPISLADINPEDGTISLIVMAVGKTTNEFILMNEGDDILDLCGPLGKPTNIEKAARVTLVGGGFGVAPLYPIARAFKAAGSYVAIIMGARSHDLLVYEKEMAEVSDKVIVTTDDGSKGTKGVVTTALKQEIDANGADLVLTVGPAIMMKFVSETTRPYGIKTIVSLNPIMVDGTGMCGGCRVPIGNDTKFACTDGPEFDGHLVDWDLLMSRQKTYQNEEKVSFVQWKSRHADIITEGK